MLLSSMHAVSSSPVDIPEIRYGTIVEKETDGKVWCWSDVSSPIFRCSEKVYLIFFWVIIILITFSDRQYLRY